MGEEEKSFKQKVKDIEENKKIKDDDKSSIILKLIDSTIEGKKDDEIIKFFKDEVSDKYLDKYIGEPLKVFKLVDEKYSQQVEPVYFWVLGFIREQLGAKKVDKLVDTYSASEASAFHRNLGQGLASTQDRVVASLRNIASLVQHLFRIVREISMINERLSLYYEGEKIGPETEKKQNYPEMTLKDRYITFIEGGTKNPGSVLGLSKEVGFITLPHYFYHNHIFKKDDVGKVVDNIQGINKTLKEVLGRKLRAYLGWRESSLQNLEQRRKFILSFLKQHYNSIMLNIEWVKPYLKTARRMTLNEKFKDSPDLLAAIEQAMMEIELLAIVKKDDNGFFNQVLNPVIRFRTNPESDYSPKYQAVHTKFTGRVEIELRARVMSNNRLLAYKAKIEKEDFTMLGFDESIKEAIESFGDELKLYLDQADKDIDVRKAVKEAMEKRPSESSSKEEKKKPQKLGFPGLEPFVQVFKGFGELGGAFVQLPSFKGEKEKKTPEHKLKKEESDAQEGAIKAANRLYVTFKKSHGMLAF